MLVVKGSAAPGYFARTVKKPGPARAGLRAENRRATKTRAENCGSEKTLSKSRVPTPGWYPCFLYKIRDLCHAFKIVNMKGVFIRIICTK